MYSQQYPFYYRNTNGGQIPPCMRNSENVEMMNPSNMLPEAEMPEDQLGAMYPTTYIIIYPHVIRHCDMFDNACCSMKIPTNEEIEQMTDNISNNVEMEVESGINSGMRESENRQLGFQGRGLLRDLTRILLLREFFERRHRPHHRFHHHHMGY